MDPPRFVDHFRTLHGLLRIGGLSTPWGEKPSFIRRVIMSCYNTLLVAIVCSFYFFIFYAIMNNSLPFDELCFLGEAFSVLGTGLGVTLCLVISKKKLKAIIEHMDSIAASIYKTELGGEDYFQELYKKNAKMITVLVKIMVNYGFLVNIAFVWSVPVMDWYSGNYRAQLPIRIDCPFDCHAPLFYELMVLLFYCSLSISIMKKSEVDCLFLSLFNIQITFLRYLRVTKRNFQEDFGNTNNTLIKKRLAVWIKLHQEVNLLWVLWVIFVFVLVNTNALNSGKRNIQQLVAVFSPVVIMYSALTICLVVFGAFVQMKNETTNLFQSVTMGSYVGLIVLFQFLMSRVADELSDEAKKLAFFAYDLPWYEMKKADADMVRMVILKANHQILVTAYHAPIFIINRETFTGFVVSSISVFLTFCQIMERFS